MSHPINDMMGTTMGKIREIVDANTMIGDPIVTPDGVTIIPISKVSFGFAGGGSDYVSKHVNTGTENPFGGGSGAGVNITPVAFLVIRGESVRVLPVASPANTTADRIIELLPDLIDKVSALLDRSKKEPETPAEMTGI